MVVIYGLIFNVDLKKGRRFMLREDVARERETQLAECELFK